MDFIIESEHRDDEDAVDFHLSRIFIAVLHNISTRENLFRTNYLDR